MTLEGGLTNQEYDKIQQEYCGSLGLDMAFYIKIQKGLLEEQMGPWYANPLERKILEDERPESIEEFRAVVLLTTYEDYMDVFLLGKKDILPDKPIIQIQTTWEGGKYPIRVAPYTSGMLRVYKNNIPICLMATTSKGKGSFDIGIGNTFLYGLVPLSYTTGLIPLGLSGELHIEFLPPVNEAVNTTFSEWDKKGPKMGLEKGIDFFFGIGSVVHFASMNTTSLSEGGKKGGSFLKKLFTMLLSMTPRYLKAKKQCERKGRGLMPKDLLRLKGFLRAGTDNHCHKGDLEELWGTRPAEVLAGTEPSSTGTEMWNRDGPYFFPGARFHEFILGTEMYKNLDNPSYVPRTICMDEVIAGEVYEIVLTVLKGGAFTQCRVGNAYRCLGFISKEDKARIPRFKYIDRIPNIIDIAGFTRASKNSIKNVINLSGIGVTDWAALKEFTEGRGRSYLRMYVELAPGRMASRVVSQEPLEEHLIIYFKYANQDCYDLRYMLGMDPLEIIVLRCGTFASYRKKTGKTL